jgi:hypothetical protein
VTIAGTTVPVLATTLSLDSSDTENASARPFVALKDRFHKVSLIHVTLIYFHIMGSYKNALV